MLPGAAAATAMAAPTLLPAPRMACAPALMDKERRYFDTLARVARYAVADDGGAAADDGGGEGDTVEEGVGQRATERQPHPHMEGA